ncbi:hypothetical protein SLEP1_g39475 [Rubroshorea leprosula]|uniref:Uncharacterized protein n=1 Tax=Rubroshorea leprosula TaxID=152421 RepID=A0AAV5L0Y7_9ROSI|nr:hypothetical protein SLEP1_g39475 [Rubroshorea leprosula]
MASTCTSPLLELSLYDDGHVHHVFYLHIMLHLHPVMDVWIQSLQESRHGCLSVFFYIGSNHGFLHLLIILFHTLMSLPKPLQHFVQFLVVVEQENFIAASYYPIATFPIALAWVQLTYSPSVVSLPISLAPIEHLLNPEFSRSGLLFIPCPRAALAGGELLGFSGHELLLQIRQLPCSPEPAFACRKILVPDRSISLALRPSLRFYASEVSKVW